MIHANRHRLTCGDDAMLGQETLDRFQPGGGEGKPAILDRRDPARRFLVAQAIDMAAHPSLRYRVSRLRTMAPCLIANDSPAHHSGGSSQFPSLVLGSRAAGLVRGGASATRQPAADPRHVHRGLQLQRPVGDRERGRDRWIADRRTIWPGPVAVLSGYVRNEYLAGDLHELYSTEREAVLPSVLVPRPVGTNPVPQPPASLRTCAMTREQKGPVGPVASPITYVISSATQPTTSPATDTSAALRHAWFDSCGFAPLRGGSCELCGHERGCGSTVSATWAAVKKRCLGPEQLGSCPSSATWPCACPLACRSRATGRCCVL